MPDAAGVSLGGALKNIVALATGFVQAKAWVTLWRKVFLWRRLRRQRLMARDYRVSVRLSRYGNFCRSMERPSFLFSMRCTVSSLPFS